MQRDFSDIPEELSFVVVDNAAELFTLFDKGFLREQPEVSLAYLEQDDIWLHIDSLLAGLKETEQKEPKHFVLGESQAA